MVPYARRLGWIVLVACALLGIGPAAAADWPMVSHDPSGNHSQTDQNAIGLSDVARLALRWTLTVGGIVNSTPAVVDGAVYFPDGGGKFWKVDAKTGAVIWSVSVADLSGIPKATSRTSPAVVDGVAYIATNRGNLIAVDTATGAKKWMTQVESHPSALITSSPVIVADAVYIAVSSSEQSQLDSDASYPCCTFRGSIVALDRHSGQIIWKTYTMPDNGGKAGGYSGGAALAIPAINAARGLIYFTTDHQYTQPDSVVTCLKQAGDDWDRSCFSPDARFDSVIALDLTTGKVRWSFFGAGADVYRIACGTLPNPWNALGRNYAGDKPGRMCPPAGDFLDWSFATGSPQLFTASIDGTTKDLVGIGEKSGIYWALDAATGDVVWHSLLGPYSEPGGITWGAAYDGKRIYASLTNADHIPFRLLSGDFTDGGAWSALDPATGKVLWQAAVPSGGLAYAAPVVADGVLYVSSLAAAGPQMFALDPETGSLKWSFAAGGSVGAHPAVADGAVFWGSGFTLIKGSVKDDKFYSFSIDGK